MATPRSVTVTSTETLIYGGGIGRSLTISNTGANRLHYSVNPDSTVTPENGIPLDPGGSYEFIAPLYCTETLPIIRGVTRLASTTVGISITQ